MNILYVGDIMGRPGRETIKTLLPDLREELKVDFVIAQGENLTHGKGMSIAHTEEMMKAGVDFFTSGNWTLHRPEIYPWLEDLDKPVIRPANYPVGTPGRGYKIVATPFGKILVASLLGQVVGYIDHIVDNPLKIIDQILEETKDENLVARIVNFHGDFSSEKLVIGQYLDGRVTAVIGDHWHIPTGDPKLLPRKTAHITDVGMVGSYDSCLGVETDVIVKRWLLDKPSRNELEENGTMQLCAVLIKTDSKTGLAKSITQIIRYIKS